MPLQPELNRMPNRQGHTFVGGIQRGMIFWGGVAASEAQDSEHFHPHNNPCPWIVLSSEGVHRKLPIVLAAPLTSKLEKRDGAPEFRHYRIRILHSDLTHFDLPPGSQGLTGDSLVLVEQLRVFAHERLIGNPIALAPFRVLAAIEPGLAYALAIGI